MLKIAARLVVPVLTVVVFTACGKLIPPPAHPDWATSLSDGAVFQNRNVRYQIGRDARNQHWIDERTGLDYLETNSPCARVKIGGKDFPATAATFQGGLLNLKFGQANAEAVIRVTLKSNYFLFDVVSLAGAALEEFVFADVPLKLRGSPGEPFAATILALNLQTLVKDFPQPVSRLTASCFPRFGFAGAQAALAACPPAELRGIIQEVVTHAPGLPKSFLGGPWAWDAPAARGSYLFDFGNLNEQTADDWIRLVQSLGFTQIDFHGGRSFRFGDCQVNQEVFPRGRAGFKAALDKLHAAGISAGLHTYAFFIDKKAEWVTPIPDPRLASDRTFTLSEALGTNASTVPVVESTETVSAITGFFVRNSVTLRLDQELITYTAASKTPPFVFTGCHRGAHGTRIAEHPQGTKAHHLKECFGLFVPDPETTLLAEVAQRTADFYNECGFDMIYLDALDGEDILGGAENSWHYGSQFVFELAQRLQKPALMEMSTFHHHLWYVRSRAGAWDHPRRAQKEFIDLHLTANEGNHRMFLPGNLGWWAVKNWNGAQEERTFPDDIEYLCGKALGTDSGLSLMGIDPKNADAMSRLAGIFRRYETLRQSHQVPETIKEKLRVHGDEFRLVTRTGAAPEFHPTRFASQKVGTLDARANVWSSTNRFSPQPLQLRIESLMSAGVWDAETNVVLADAESLSFFTNRASAPGVTASLSIATDAPPIAADSAASNSVSTALAFFATNAGSSARGAWAKTERTFTPPLNLAGLEGLGLWVHGDGQGEILNLQLRCPEHVVAGIGDHYIVVDFTGWRYFELVEPESRRWAFYSWPYGDPYSIYRESVIFNQVSSLSLWFNNLPPGKSVTCHLSAVKALPLSKSVLRRPSVTLAGKTVLYPTDLESGSYLEAISPTDCKVYGPNGQLLREVQPEGDFPVLEAGGNQLSFSCESTTHLHPRAKVTVISEGPALVP